MLTSDWLALSSQGLLSNQTNSPIAPMTLKVGAVGAVALQVDQVPTIALHLNQLAPIVLRLLPRG